MCATIPYTCLSSSALIVAKHMSKPTIILGVTGSVAAYKSADLIRRLRDSGLSVHVAMTPSAAKLIGPPTLRALSGHPVMLDEWQNPAHPDGMDHIAGSRGAALFLVAPASADFIAKAAHGFAGGLLPAMMLARECPALIAPAMNQAMWKNPATQSNLQILAEAGVNVIPPAEGSQACGEEGAGRLADIADIVKAVQEQIGNSTLLAGVHVVVSAGATCEYIDPMRIISNASSGKMGIAVANAAKLLGADVTLVAGRIMQAPPAGMKTVGVETGAQMEAALRKLASKTDIFVSAAAVGDFRAKTPMKSKVSSSRGLALELERNTDILHAIAGLKHAPLCVGFAAETEDMEKNARKKMKRKGVSMVVANDPSTTVGQDMCELLIVETSKTTPIRRMSKTKAAKLLMEHVAMRFLDSGRKRARKASTLQAERKVSVF